MPLSDHEQRLLEQMERALYQEDPKFASSLRRGRGETIDRARIVVGSLGSVVGLVVVVVAVSVSVPALGVLGFAGMVAGAYWAWQGINRPSPSDVGVPIADARPLAATGRGLKPAKGQSDFMAKMEERWRKRRDGNGRY